MTDKLNDSEHPESDESNNKRLPVILTFDSISFAPEGYAKLRSKKESDQSRLLALGDGDGNDIEMQSKDERIDIIRGISGVAAPGKILAILGPSGSGKTTLMDVMAHRKTSGNIKGEILVNSKVMPRKEFRRLSGYVLQDDVMHGQLTVEETLTFSARLRLPQTLKDCEIKQKVEKIMEELGLTHIRNSYIGNALIRGISGGEKKRVSIGIELVTDPSVLFLDEPTSGLDSSSAFNVILFLKKMARSGRTVICTIHQPSSEIFSLFDNILLLTENGDLGYIGPAENALPYFKETFGLEFGQYVNPADVLIRLVASNKSLDSQIHEDLLSKESWCVSTNSPPERVKEFSDTFVNSGLAKSFFQSESLAYQALEKEHNQNTLIQSPSKDLKFATTFGRQFSVVAHRAFLTTIRDPMQGIAMFFIAILFGLIMGSLYFQSPLTQAGFKDRTGALFFLAMNGAFSNLGSLEVFLLERTIFVRERANGMYRTSAYFLGKILPDLPQRILPGIPFSLIVYFMVGFRTALGNFLKFFLVTSVNTLLSYALCLFVSSFAPSFAIANLVAPMIIILMIIPSGLLVNIASIPSYWAWLKYISFFKYSFEALMINEFQGRSLTCSVDEFTPPGCKESGSSICVCPVENGDLVIEGLGFAVDVFWRNVGILFLMLAVFLSAAYICLRILQKERR